MINYQISLVKAAALAAGLLILSACGSDNNAVTTAAPTAAAPAPVTQTFEVSVINLTASQPFSPLALIVHNSGYNLFSVGQPVTTGLEVLAEGGDNSQLLAEVSGNNSVQLTLSGASPIRPGETGTLTVAIEEAMLSGMLVSSATMLVNTNDAFVAARNISIEGMEIGDVRRSTAVSYDAGTEANSEAAGTIPGPADGGEGFNATRDDIADELRMHAGVLTADQGLAGSVLSEIHRWDYPAARFSVRRVR